MNIETTSKQLPSVLIEYRHVPFGKELTEAFTMELSHINKDIKVWTPGALPHSSWEFAKDLYVFIGDHLVELFASGILTNAVYDISKASVRTLWNKITAKKTLKQRLIKFHPRIVIKLEDILLLIHYEGGSEEINRLLSSFETSWAETEFSQIIQAFSLKENQELRITFKYNKKKKMWETTTKIKSWRKKR